MHPRFSGASQITDAVIGAAIEVHRHFGPGLLESVYEWALGVELTDRGLRGVKQKIIRISYKGRTREELLRCDLLVEDCLLLEIKAMKEIEPIHEAQLLSYMRLLDIPLGIILNFHAPTMGKGIRRLILKASTEQEDLHVPEILRIHTEDAEIAE